MPDCAPARTYKDRIRKKTSPSSRRTARATVGGGFPIHTLSVVRRVPSSTMVAVSVQLSSHPGRSDFPSPVGGGSLSRRASGRTSDSRARSHTSVDPFVIGSASSCDLPVTARFGSVSEGVGCRTTAVYREPLCTSNGLAVRVRRSRRRSAGITLPSLLLRAHAPDHPAPVGFGLPYSFGSSRVVSSPRCRAVFPDVISAIRVSSPGSVPRHARAVLPSVSSRPAPASPKGQGAWLVEQSRNAVLRGGLISGLQPFAHVQAP